jgi:hypothetical protein
LAGIFPGKREGVEMNGKRERFSPTVSWVIRGESCPECGSDINCVMGTSLKCVNVNCPFEMGMVSGLWVDATWYNKQQMQEKEKGLTMDSEIDNDNVNDNDNDNNNPQTYNDTMDYYTFTDYKGREKTLEVWSDGGITSLPDAITLAHELIRVVKSNKIVVDTLTAKINALEEENKQLRSEVA